MKQSKQAFIFRVETEWIKTEISIHVLLVFCVTNPHENSNMIALNINKSYEIEVVFKLRYTVRYTGIMDKPMKTDNEANRIHVIVL